MCFLFKPVWIWQCQNVFMLHWSHLIQKNRCTSYNHWFNMTRSWWGCLMLYLSALLHHPFKLTVSRWNPACLLLLLCCVFSFSVLVSLLFRCGKWMSHPGVLSDFTVCGQVFIILSWLLGHCDKAWSVVADVPQQGARIHHVSCRFNCKATENAKCVFQIWTSAVKLNVLCKNSLPSSIWFILIRKATSGRSARVDSSSV